MHNKVTPRLRNELGCISERFDVQNPDIALNSGLCACRSILDINLGIPGTANARVHCKKGLLASGRMWISVIQPGRRTDITLHAFVSSVHGFPQYWVGTT